MTSVPFVTVIVVSFVIAGSPADMIVRAETRQSAPATTAAPPDAASVIAKCADAMGGAAAIKTLRTLRVEVVYPDHDATPVAHEVRRPNQLRTERPGAYVLVFDGRRASYEELDPAKKGHGPRIIPAAHVADMDVDIAWLVPAFFDYPAEYLGEADSTGTRCHKLGVTLPHGARAVYSIDVSTNLIKTIAVDLTLEGRPYHAEREWKDYRTVQGIRYPYAMTYAGRDKATQTALFQSVAFNPPLADGRFSVPADAK